MEFRSIKTIQTAENVPVKVELAGIASRVFAFLLDFLAMILLIGCFVLVFILPSTFRRIPEIQKTVIPLGIFLIFFGYHLFQEWLWNGCTLGKKLLGLRVVRQNGQPIGLWESLGRNLLRLIDVYAGGIGLCCMMFQPMEKRFGDLLAGTLVIQNQVISRYTYQQLLLETASESLSARLLTAEEAEFIQAFLARSKTFLKAEREMLTQELCTYFTVRFSEPFSTEADLEQLLTHYQANLLGMARH